MDNQLITIILFGIIGIASALYALSKHKSIYSILLLIFFIISFLLTLNEYMNKNKSRRDMRDNMPLKSIRNNNQIIKDFSVDSNNKISLTGNKVEKYYNKNTLDEHFKIPIIEFIKIILKKTNRVNNYEHYVVKEIHDVHQQIDMNRNQRYLVHFFIYNLKTYTTKKLLVDFVIINSQLYINYIGDDIASIYGMVDRYDVKVSMAIQNMKKPYSYGYLGKKNTVQLMDEFYRLKKLNLIQYDKSINEYPDYISKLNGVFKEDITDLINKYLPSDTPSITSPTFCENIDSTKWDKYGINKQLSNCTANNNTTGYIPNIPLDLPGSDIHPRSYDGKYSEQLQMINFDTTGYNIPTLAQ